MHEFEESFNDIFTHSIVLYMKSFSFNKSLQQQIIDFACLTNFVALKGGAIKREQMLSGGMADIFSNLYLALSVQYYHQHYPTSQKLTDYVIQRLMAENQQSINKVVDNLGLQKYLNNLGLDLFRTPVGDRYVAEIMNMKGFNFGGENSGHIIMTDYSSTGDGLLAALHFLSILKKSKKNTSELLNVFEPFPQKLVNLKFEPENDPLENLEFKKTIEKLSSAIANSGEILVRKSGTEPVIRIMIQHSNSKMIDPILKEIENKISNL